MNEQKEKHIYTVSELTKYVRVILEDSFPAVWIEGEISNFVLHSSGHMYFSLIGRWQNFWVCAGACV